MELLIVRTKLFRKASISSIFVQLDDGMEMVFRVWLGLQHCPFSSSILACTIQIDFIYTRIQIQWILLTSVYQSILVERAKSLQVQQQLHTTLLVVQSFMTT